MWPLSVVISPPVFKQIPAFIQGVDQPPVQVFTIIITARKKPEGFLRLKLENFKKKFRKVFARKPKLLEKSSN